MRIEYEVKLGFKDVMIRPKRSTLKSRAQVDLNRTYVFRHTQKTWTGIPVIAANMDTVGTFAMTDELARYGLLTAVHKHYSPDDWQRFLETRAPSIYDHIMVSAGASDEDFIKLKDIIRRSPKLSFICIDVANGYTEFFVDYVKKIRETFPEKLIAAGNVVTGEMVEELILAGADMIKVGIGPGSVCTTRVKTGVGYPQLSAIIECADAAHGLKGLIIADGGCTCPGDVAKAFGAGADFVMLGGMFAGHDECGGEILELGGERCVEFYGMSSSTAMEKYNGGVAEYRASEGKTVIVPYRGSVEGTVQDILGGIRSTCTYVGAAKLKELAKRTTFIRTTEQENKTFK
ncbi:MULTISPECIES: GMP reductase [Desulfococcus]|jgi:GMP reductase|uniref:GMP reductase n=1 Tax=Desulfococcus multivorans DSM 2059 TaxID=1121405 RepID=S7TE34_DESML|nr:GMP reductase [Desulfococcus multivorans]AOY58192.1 GuaC: guanosine 5\'-monophosphate oxidoreductase [Desulfococcus multivorans]AQV00541.1 guanosine monophosphate reductase [Desulfococcus multivorans]EPR34830.1 guanosine monophosphate reductase [Desulfococcus multivorans DSM 2059]MDX9819172.1 GMP reductase [Desulfococcus multivorans]SJZ96216.1 GMP reductase [Desulfococcus multivorans DSM 2059]